MSDRSIEILLVEDNLDEVELALHSLRVHSLAPHVHVVRDGVEALTFLFGPEGNTPRRPDRDGPKVVLLDLRVPKIDGREVLTRLKADPVTRTIPVVVLTSSLEADDVLECYRLGVNSYVVKPVDFKQFSEVVRALGQYWLSVNATPVFT